jgi:hypothetical protein
MSEVIEQQREDVAANAAPSSTADDIDQALAEFDSVNQPAPEPAEPDQSNAGAPEQTFDQQLAEILGPDLRVGQLENEINSLRAAEYQRQERADFDAFSNKLQGELGPNVDEQFARRELLSMSVENPALVEAWKYRHITAEQRQAADREFQQLEVLYARAQQAGDDPRKAQAMAALERRGQELGLMMNAHTILNSAWRDVRNRAKSVAPPISEEATAWRAEVAAAVRSAGGRVEDPPPKLGNLSDQEYRKYLQQLGIAGF